MKKTYILDTNVLMHDPQALFSFGENEVIIPLVVLDELDKHKGGMTQTAIHTRMTIKYLDELRALGKLSNGVLTEAGGIIRVYLSDVDLNTGLNPEVPDNKIINVALSVKEKYGESQEIVVVTKDINVRVKCDALDINAEDYFTDSVAKNLDELYVGHSELLVDDVKIDELYKDGEIPTTDNDFYMNEYVHLKSNLNQQHSALAKFDGHKLVKVNTHKNVWGISPRNKEQSYAFDALFDDNIKLVTLTGKAGSGKTILSVAAAVSQLLDTKKYNKIIITRPLVPMGKEIGFLKGDLNEKMTPWLGALFDAMDVVFSEKGKYFIDNLLDEGRIEIQALTHIRGRSLPKSFIIVDESQLLTQKEVKTIVSRTGEDSKMVLVGDVFQIDTPYLGYNDNGLSCIADTLKDEKITTHVQLMKGERSELATLVAEKL